MTRKSQAKPNTRGRSTSRGRRSKAPSKSPSRQRSRSRKSKSKVSRTPTSDSRVVRRRSPSSSTSPEPTPVVLRPRQKKTVSKASGDTMLASSIASKNSHHRDRTPTRISQRIVEKIEQAGSTRNLDDYKHHSSARSKPNGHIGLLAALAQGGDKCAYWSYKHICMSPLLAALNMCVLIPFLFWINLLVFAPTTENVGSVAKYPQTYWGTGYPYAKVIWPTDWRAYFNPYAIFGVWAYFMLHLLLARYLPIGRLVSSNPNTRHKDYRCNGMVSLLTFIALFAGAQYFGDKYLHGLKPSNLLPKYWLTFMTACTVASVQFAIYAYITVRRTTRSDLSPEGNTGNFFVDFFHGRVKRLRCCKQDMKMYCLRPGMVAMLLFDLAFVCAQWERHSRVSPALALLTAMHAIYLLTFFLFEHTFLFTYDMLHQGAGFAFFVGKLVIVPFFYTLSSSYLSLRPDVGRLPGSSSSHSCDAYTMGFAATLFLIGTWIRFAADSQKDRFRREPHHPSLATMDTLTDSAGRRLLAGGWWGITRHPNYMGEILTVLAEGIACGFSSSIPWLVPGFITALLIHRCWSSEAVCAQKHGAAWVSYTNSVKKCLIPKVW